MKKKILYVEIIISILLLSCSNNDTNVRTQNKTKVISEIRITSFIQGETNTYLTRVYENNRPKADSIFDSSNTLIVYTDWIYKDDKLVFQQNTYPNKMLPDELSISYDDFGRINQTIQNQNNSIRTTHFSYNNDNTITSTHEINGVISSKTFHLNETGVIYKETDGDETYSAVYDNDNNIVSLSTPSGVSVFSYDNINRPPMNFPVYEHFTFGAYKNNTIIYNNSLQLSTNNSSSTLVKYPLSIEHASDTTIIEWVLDSENYPIKRNVFTHNQLTSESEYIYN